MAYLNKDAVESLGLSYYEWPVYISDKCSLYASNKMSILRGARIDDFAVLSGAVTIGKYVHIAVGCALFADEIGITLQDFSGLSSHVSVYAKSMDYTQNCIGLPTVNENCHHIIEGKVNIGQNVIVGSKSTILPAAVLPFASVYGANSLILNRRYESATIYGGVPVKKLGDRNVEGLTDKMKYHESA
jgi:galactoside O-acetyltransferase